MNSDSSSLRRVTGRYFLAAMALSLTACSSTEDPPAANGGTTSKGGATASSGGAVAAGGTLASGGATSQGGAVAGGKTGSGGAGSGGVTAAGGTSATGGSTTQGGAVSGGAGGGAAGATQGGASAQGGGSARGGASAQGGAGTGGASGGATGQGGSGGAGPSGCPSGVLFCADFETAGLPTGATFATYNDKFEDAVKFDTMIFKGGKQSAKVLTASNSMRYIAAPAPQAFWFRLYMQTDVAVDAMGQKHNVFVTAVWPNEDKGIEIAEEDCAITVNIHDTRYGSNGTMNQPGCPTGANKGVQMDANKWYCLEGHFDGASGDVEVFVDGKEAVKVPGVAKHPYNALRFGYRNYNNRPRNVWYDDVVVSATRVPCQ
jgi:hypothetical protein